MDNYVTKNRTSSSKVLTEKNFSMSPSKRSKKKSSRPVKESKDVISPVKANVITASIPKTTQEKIDRMYSVFNKTTGNIGFLLFIDWLIEFIQRSLH